MIQNQLVQVQVKSVDITTERALKLLGQGLDAKTVASAVGVSESRISQLLSDSSFSEQVAQLRCSNLTAHTERDEKLDKLEDKLLDKMNLAVNMLFKPEDILKAYQVINAAKRRGAQGVQSLGGGVQTVINLTLPTKAVEGFKVNIHNQVTEAGGQSLLTIQSSALLGSLNRTLEAQRSQDMPQLTDIELEEL